MIRDPGTITPRSTRPGILILGGSGMLGRSFCELFHEQGRPFLAPPRCQVDLARPATLEACFLQHWREIGLVINCAAWTDVDGAEAHPRTAYQVNTASVARLIDLCRDNGMPLVHYGSDYVFDGRAADPYPPQAQRCPINVYGQTKAEGEALVEQAAANGQDCLLIRTSWVYAPWGKSFVSIIAQLAKKQPVLRVIDDQRGRPTYAPSLARLSWQLIHHGRRGLWHLCDGGECSRFELAQAIVGAIAAPCQVEPCKTDEFPRPAMRPAYSVLDISATQGLLGPLPPWRENVVLALARMGLAPPSAAGPDRASA